MQMTQANSLNPMESIHRASPAGHKIQYFVTFVPFKLLCHIFGYMCTCTSMAVCKYMCTPICCRRD